MTGSKTNLDDLLSDFMKGMRPHFILFITHTNDLEYMQKYPRLQR
jgi:hypothetical protein